MLVMQVLVGRREKLSVYGNDYATRDGASSRGGQAHLHAVCPDNLTFSVSTLPHRTRTVLMCLTACSPAHLLVVCSSATVFHCSVPLQARPSGTTSTWWTWHVGTLTP